MKKLMLLSIIFICGCSNKLTCTYKTEYDDIKIKNKIVFDFDNNSYEQVDKMIFKDIIGASNYYNEIESYKEEYNLVLDDNKIISRLTGDITLNGEKDEIKEKYEGYYYKCK